MKFVVTRTSAYDEQPCEEAKRIMVPCWHTRTLTEENFDIKFGPHEGKWRSKGKNHKEIPSGNGNEKNWIIRQEADKEAWGVTINSLKDLLKFTDKYGQLVIGSYDYSGISNIMSIEIYDGYRE